MADAREPQRSLWLQILWKPLFRSDRERLAYYAVVFVLAFLFVSSASIFEWPALTTALCGLGVIILYVAGIWAWLTWGRERFPVAPTRRRAPVP